MNVLAGIVTVITGMSARFGVFNFPHKGPSQPPRRNEKGEIFIWRLQRAGRAGKGSSSATTFSYFLKSPGSSETPWPRRAQS